MRLGSICLLLFAVISNSVWAQRANPYSIEIDLQEQRAYLIEDGAIVLAAPISSGRGGHYTTPGTFKIIEKELNHFSNMYGKIVDARGRTLVADADSETRVPRGGHFVPAPMRYFMRFNGAEGMHAGFLPGRPASHGCVCLPEEDAIALFETVPVGTPVTVFGNTAQNSRQSRRSSQFTLRAEPPYPVPLMQWR